MEKNVYDDGVVSSELKKVGSENYQCPSCGGNMVFHPESSSLYCEYCENKIEVVGTKSDMEYDFYSGCNIDKDYNNENIVYHCQNCGADNVFSANEMSVKCPFCSSTSVIKLEQMAGIKPHRVIPFKISKQQSNAIFEKSLKRRLYLPKDFKKEAKINELNGLYLPSWTYDSDVFTTYHGRLGEYYTVTVGSGKNSRTETRIRWFNIKGSKNFCFDDIVVASGKKIPPKLLEKIYPYDTNNSLVYDEKFVSGFGAEHYELNLNDGFKVAQNKMNTIMEKSIANDYSHDVVDYVSVNANYANIKYKYVLLPVWLCFYRYKNKDYYYIINAETGKLSSRLPVSVGKILLTIFIILLIVAIVAFCIIKFGNVDYYG